MLLNGISLNCETNMAFISILPVRFIKQSVHGCDFADTDSHMVKGFLLTIPPAEF